MTAAGSWRKAAQTVPADVVIANTLHLPSENALREIRAEGQAVMLNADGSAARVFLPCSNCGAPLAEHTHGPLVDGGCKRTGCKEYVP